MALYEENFIINRRPLLEDTDTDTGDDQVDERIGDRSENRPKDRFNASFILFYILGITMTVPWAFYATAYDYWMYKFRDPHVKDLHSLLTSNSTKQTPLQIEFISYLAVCSSVPYIAFLPIAMVMAHRVSLQFRVIGSLLVTLVLFTISTVFVNVNTDTWQQQFFLLTMGIVIILSGTSAISAGAVLGTVAQFPSKYITAFIAGQALGGIFASLAQIVSLAIGASSLHAALLYFMIGNVTILISLVAYVALSRSLFFKYHIYDKNNMSTSQMQLIQPPVASYRTVLRKTWKYGLSVLLVFLVSTAVYPAVAVLVQPVGREKGNKWHDIYFIPVITYLLLNCMDYLGRLLAGAIHKPRSGCLIIILNLLRIVFIPLFIFCNAQPRHSLPVWFNADYYYVLIMVAFGLSNGYLTNLPVIWTSKIVEDFEKESVSSMTSFFVGIGMGIGSVISLILVKVIPVL